MKRLIFTILGVLIFSVLFSQSSLNIRAFIDGRDQIIIKGSVIQWLHFSSCAPGRLSFQNLPTYINNTAWYPVWPDIPNAENRQKCFSSVYSELNPPLPSKTETYYLTKISGTGGMFIVQQPNDTNKFTLIIEFEDTLPPGAQWYETTIEWKSTNVSEFENNIQKKFSFYPNPTSGIINLQIKKSSNYQIQILNYNGLILEIFPAPIIAENFQIDISKYPTGMYFIKVESADDYYWGKIIKY